MDLIYILKIISIIVFPIILGINIWNVYTKSDDKADTTAWYRNGIFDIADEFPDLFEFMLWIGGLFGFLFLMIKKGPGKNSTDHGTYYGLSFTLFITLLIVRFLILGAKAIDISDTPKGDSLKPDPDMKDLGNFIKRFGTFPAGLTVEKNGIVLTSPIYITYFFSVLLVFLMIIERINSNVKWDFSDFSLPIPWLSDIISASTAHYIMQGINMYLFFVISAYVIYQFKLLKIKKTCPPGTTLSPCSSPDKAFKLLSQTTKCENDVKPVCNKEPYIICSVDENGKINGTGINKILLTHDSDNNIIISPNNKTKITSDCEESIKNKILNKLKYN